MRVAAGSKREREFGGAERVPVDTTARGSAHASPNSAGPPRCTSRDIRGGAPRRSSETISARASATASGSLSSTAHASNRSDGSAPSPPPRFPSPRSSFPASASRNRTPPTSVTTTAEASTGCPHRGVTVATTRRHVPGVSASGTSSPSFVSPGVAHQSYVGSVNATATDATGRDAGRDDRTAATNLAGVPGTARFDEKLATHRRTRDTPRSPPLAEPAGTATSRVTSSGFASGAARAPISFMAACAAAIAASASRPPVAANSRQISRCSRVSFNRLAHSFRPISAVPSRWSHPSRRYTCATDANSRRADAKSPAWRYADANRDVSDANNRALPEPDDAPAPIVRLY